jgi:molybdate transport system regulatory protein
MTFDRDNGKVMTPRKKSPLELKVRLWFERDGVTVLGEGRVALLEQIARTGCMSQAARDLGLSYKKAWEMVKAMNSAARTPFVVKASGGKGGGNSHITDAGKSAINFYRQAEAVQRQFVGRIPDNSEF